MLRIPSVNRMVFSTVEEALSTFWDQYVKGGGCLIQWRDAICTLEDIQYGEWIPSLLCLYSVLWGDTIITVDEYHEFCKGKWIPSGKLKLLLDLPS